MSIQPDIDCPLCPRLVAFRRDNSIKFPDRHNAPVPAFGSSDARVLIVGLAPGLRGANFTGRPFTGDYAGDLLYQTLKDFDFAAGTYDKHADDGLALTDCRITNAVRCVPPENKPTTEEINVCNKFLAAEIDSMPNLRVIVALGLISHKAVLKALGHKLSAFDFVHGAHSDIAPELTMISSYHCSRYNTQTKRLTPEMFADIFKQVRSVLQ